MEDDNLIISNRLKINKLWELLVCTPKSVLRVSSLKLPLNLLLSGLHNLKNNWIPALLSLLLFVGDKKMYIKILKFTHQYENASSTILWSYFLPKFFNRFKASGIFLNLSNSQLFYIICHVKFEMGAMLVSL